MVDDKTREILDTRGIKHQCFHRDGKNYIRLHHTPKIDISLTEQLREQGYQFENVSVDGDLMFKQR